MNNEEIKIIIIKIITLIITFTIFNYIYRYVDNITATQFIVWPKILSMVLFGILIGIVISLENILNILKSEKDMMQFSWSNFIVCLSILTLTFLFFKSPRMIYILFRDQCIWLVISIVFGHFLTKLITVNGGTNLYKKGD